MRVTKVLNRRLLVVAQTTELCRTGSDGAATL